MKPKCRHCKVRVGNRQKGLCWSCSLDDSVRSLYPTTSKYGRRGVGLVAMKGSTTPTVYEAGSDEKIAIMAERAAAGLPLFDPSDKPYESAIVKSDPHYKVKRTKFSYLEKRLYCEDAGLS